MSMLEAVYYPHAVPQSRAALTVLALVYDRIHLPGVLLPKQGFSASDLAPVINKLAEEEQPIVQVEPGWRYLTQYLQLLPEREYLSDFCVFPEDIRRPSPGAAESETAEPAGVIRFSVASAAFHPAFARALERQTGIRIPSIPSTVSHDLPNGEMIHMPGWGTYSANAMLYSMNRGLPLVNDDSSIPFLTGNLPEESRAQTIATSIALQSVGMILPKIRALTLEEIVAFRNESRDVIRPFRDSVMTMAADVEGLLRDRNNADEIKRAARFIAETKVIPQLNELRRFVEQPGKPWTRRVTDLAKEAPALAAAVMILPASTAALVLGARVVAEVASIRADHVEREEHVNRHGAGYLLRISEDLR